MKNLSNTIQDESNLLIVTLHSSKLTDIFITEIGSRLYIKGRNYSGIQKTFRFYYICSGKCKVNIDKSSFTCSPGTLILHTPQLAYTIVAIEDCQMYTMDFIGINAFEYIQRMGYLSNFPLLFSSDRFNVSECFETCLSECKKNPYASDIIALNCFYNIVKPFVFENFHKKDIDAPSKEAYVKKAIIFINNNYNNSALNLNAVSEHLNINSSYFARIFKSVIGTTFIKYLTYKRIKVACTLMAQGETSISKISDEVGFSNQFYFSNVWKKYNKISPSKHLKNIK